MTAQLAAGLCLCAAALALVFPPLRPRPARSRLRGLHPISSRRSGRLGRWLSPSRSGPVVTAVAVAVALGGLPGLIAGGVAGALAARLLRRMESNEERARRRRASAELPLAADLLAAALRAGAPIDRAADAVGTAISGPLGIRLVRVARALRLGATAEEAWSHIADLPAGERLGRAAVRSAASGAALAGALDRLADELRAARGAAVEAAARRVGVLVVLPLGLCFLPAFVLAGLVPVIVAVLGDLL
jgi:pilus assembly protein TadC